MLSDTPTTATNTLLNNARGTFIVLPDVHVRVQRRICRPMRRRKVKMAYGASGTC